MKQFKLDVPFFECEPRTFYSRGELLAAYNWSDWTLKGPRGCWAIVKPKTILKAIASFQREVWIKPDNAGRILPPDPYRGEAQ